MIGKPYQPVQPTVSISGIEASLELLAMRLGELHEQINYLQEHTAFVSIQPMGGGADCAAGVNHPVKSFVRAKIDELAESVEIATSRVMNIRCNLDQ